MDANEDVDTRGADATVYSEDSEDNKAGYICLTSSKYGGRV